MKMRSSLRALSVVVLFAGLATAHAQEAERVAPEVATRGQVSAERRLPPKVFAYVSVPSVEELKSRWAKSQFGRLVDDRALAEFRLDLTKQIAEASEQVERGLGMPLEDLLEIPSGEVTFAVVQPAGTIAVLGLLDFGGSRAEVDKLLEKAEEGLKAENAERKTSEFEGTRIVTYVLPTGAVEDGDADENEGVPAEGGRFSYFIKDTHLAVASDVSALEAVLARWNGRHEQTFADNAFHRYIQSRCTTPGGTPVAAWFIDPIGLLTAALTSGEQADIQVALVLGFLPQLGLDSLKGMGGSMELGTAEYDSVSRTFIYVEPPVSGVLNVFQFPARDLTPPNWVTGDVASYSAGNWDVAGAYAAIEKLVDGLSMQPGMFKQLIDNISNEPGAPNVHLKQDIVDQLTGRFHFVSDFTDPDDVETGRMLVALEVKDAAKMQGVLATIAQTDGFPGEVRQFRGETIYEVEQQLPGAGAEAMKMAFGVAQGHLMFASQVTLLEQVLRQDQDRRPLAESPVYKKVAAHFPEKVSMISYSRDAVAVQGAYKTLRSGQLGMLIPGIDFSKLPPFEDLRKYLGDSGSYSVPDRNGALLVDFTLKANEN
ncbi:MAG: DUF3352 domain-containing protein [Planctomycetaceae bacterium]